MNISQDVWATLEKLERGRYGRSEETLAEWIAIGDDMDAQMVIALVHNIIARAADEKEAMTVRSRPEYGALIDLVMHSPLQQIIFYAPSTNTIALADHLAKEDAIALIEFIAQFGMTIE